MNEVPEKDKLHPVALPAFPSTAPTGHVRRQVSKHEHSNYGAGAALSNPAMQSGDRLPVALQQARCSWALPYNTPD